MKIKVAYVIPSLDTGGSESKVITLAAGLDQNQFESIIITITKQGNLLKYAQNQGIQVISTNKRHQFDVFVIRRIKKILKRENIDIVHVFTSTGKLWGRIAAICAKTKVIISTEESLFRGKKSDIFFEKFFAKKTDLIITNSYATMHSAINHTKFKEEKYFVIHNGIDLLPFIKKNKSNDEQGLRHEWLMMSVARLDQRKGLDILIEALAILKTKDIFFKSFIIGEGRERKSLELLVQKHQLTQHISFLGERQDVAQLLNNADIFILPSREEGFGNVIIEAMASKVISIASNVGGIPEIIKHQHNGLLFEKGDSNDLYQQINYVIHHQSHINQMIEQASKDAMRFSKDHMIQAHEKIYIKLLNGAD